MCQVSRISGRFWRTCRCKTINFGPLSLSVFRKDLIPLQIVSNRFIVVSKSPAKNPWLARSPFQNLGSRQSCARTRKSSRCWRRPHRSALGLQCVWAQAGLCGRRATCPRWVSAFRQLLPIPAWMNENQKSIKKTCQTTTPGERIIKLILSSLHHLSRSPHQWNLKTFPLPNGHPNGPSNDPSPNEPFNEPLTNP